MTGDNSWITCPEGQDLVADGGDCALLRVVEVGTENRVAYVLARAERLASLLVEDIGQRVGFRKGQPADSASN